MPFGDVFRGLDAEAFAAFEPRKQGSNQYNRERMKLRDALQSVGSALEQPVGRDRHLRWDVSPHAPCLFNGHRVQDMVLFFTRSGEQQKAIAPLLDSRIALPDQVADSGEHHRHATLGARVTADGVEAGLLLHSTAWLDVMNLLNRCHASAEAGEFVRLVRALGPQAVIRVAPGTEIPAPEFDTPQLHRLEEAVLDEPFLVLAGRRIAPGDTVLSASTFVAFLRDLLLSLLPLWDFATWRPASNWLLPSSSIPAAALASSSGPHPAASAGTHDALVLSAGGGVVDFGVGAKVKLVDGVLAGRPGVVTEIDGKGHVRVLVGKVAMRVDARHVRPV